MERARKAGRWLFTMLFDSWVGGMIVGGLIMGVPLPACTRNLKPNEELAPTQFHGDKLSPLGCVCLAHQGHVVCECDPDAVRTATGIWK